MDEAPEPPTEVVDHPTAESALPAAPEAGTRRFGRVVDAARARTGASFDALAAHSKARVSLYRLRRVLEQLEESRGERFRELGEAVYQEDEAGAAAAKAALRDLDERARSAEAEAAAIVQDADRRIERAQASSRPTVAQRSTEPADEEQES